MQHLLSLPKRNLSWLPGQLKGLLTDCLMLWLNICQMGSIPKGLPTGVTVQVFRLQRQQCSKVLLELILGTLITRVLKRVLYSEFYATLLQAGTITLRIAVTDAACREMLRLPGLPQRPETECFLKRNDFYSRMKRWESFHVWPEQPWCGSHNIRKKGKKKCLQHGEGMAQIL